MEEDESDAEESKLSVKPKKVHEAIAKGVSFDDRGDVISYRLHRFSPVCVCFSSDGQFVVSCSKDGSTIKCIFFNIYKHYVCYLNLFFL